MEEEEAPTRRFEARLPPAYSFYDGEEDADESDSFASVIEGESITGDLDRSSFFFRTDHQDSGYDTGASGYDMDSESGYDTGCTSGYDGCESSGYDMAEDTGSSAVGEGATPQIAVPVAAQPSGYAVADELLAGPSSPAALSHSVDDSSYGSGYDSGYSSAGGGFPAAAQAQFSGYDCGAQVPPHDAGQYSQSTGFEAYGYGGAGSSGGAVANFSGYDTAAAAIPASFGGKGYGHCPGASGKGPSSYGSDPFDTGSGYVGGGSDPFDAGGSYGGGVTGYQMVSLPAAAPAQRAPRPPSGTGAGAGRDWNTEFQRILEMPNDTPQERLERALRVRKFKGDFEEKAVEHARTIIEEVHLPNLQKSIRSLDVGGQAGGEKYMADNIFFKFAIDSSDLYGGDEHAMKAASHELMGLRSYYDFIAFKSSEGASPPLRVGYMTLIDYRGYRLIATCLLPIGKDTLLYGSCDAGRTVMTEDETLNQLMQEAAQWMNIKGHFVGMNIKKEIYGPCDIEAHIGKDGHFYVLDTARVYPPEAPSRTFVALLIPQNAVVDTGKKSKQKSGQKADVETEEKKQMMELEVRTHKYVEQLRRILGDNYRTRRTVACTIFFTGVGEVNHCASFVAGIQVLGDAVLIPDGFKSKSLYNLLRPEFVRSCIKPLSSDAFTGFGRDRAIVHNTEVRKASNRLLEEVIPELCKALDERQLVPSNSHDLLCMMKAKGINFRFLGVMYHCLTLVGLKLMVATQMVTRCVKNILRAQMRQLKGRQLDFKEAIVRQCNLVLGKSNDSEMYWSTVLRLLMLEKYATHSVAQWTDKASIEEIRATVSPVMLLKTIQYECGIELRPQVFEEATRRFSTSTPLGAHDILQVKPKVKSLQRDEELLELFSRAAEAADSASTEFLSTVTKVYGLSSAEVVCSRLEEAYRCLRSHCGANDLEGMRRGAIDALEQFRLIFSGRRRALIPEKCVAAGWHMVGILYRRAGKPEEAAGCFLSCIQGIRECADVRTEEVNGVTFIEFPFLLRVFNDLHEVQLQLGRWEEADLSAAQFARLWEVSPVISTDGRVREFGFDLPTALASFLEKNVRSDVLRSFEKPRTGGAVPALFPSAAVLEEMCLERRLLRECFQGKTTRRWFEPPPAVLDMEIGIPSHTWLLGPTSQAVLSSVEEIEASGRAGHAELFSQRGAQFIRVFALVRRRRDKFSVGASLLDAGGVAFRGCGIDSQSVRTPFKTWPAHEISGSWLGAIIPVSELPGPGTYVFGAIPERSELMEHESLSEPILICASGTGASEKLMDLVGYKLLKRSRSLKIVPSSFSFKLHFSKVHTYCASANDFVAMGILDDGSLYTWGTSSSGILGHGDRVKRTEPTMVQALRGSRVAFVRLISGTHAYAVMATGELFTWGDNRSQQLGHGDKETRLAPRIVKKLEGKRVVAVDAHSCGCVAVTDAGAVYGWGILRSHPISSSGLPELFVQLSGISVRTVCVTEEFSLFTCDGGLVYAISHRASRTGVLSEFSGRSYLRLDSLTHQFPGTEVTVHTLTMGDTYTTVEEEKYLHISKVAAGTEMILALTDQGELYAVATSKAAIQQHCLPQQAKAFTVGQYSSSLLRIAAPARVQEEGSPVKEDPFIDVEYSGGLIMAITASHRVWLWGFKQRGQSHLVLPRCIEPNSRGSLQSVTLSDTGVCAIIDGPRRVSLGPLPALDPVKRHEAELSNWSLTVAATQTAVVPFKELQLQWSGPPLALTPEDWIQVVDVNSGDLLDDRSVFKLSEKEVPVQSTSKVSVRTENPRVVRVELWGHLGRAVASKLAETHVRVRDYSDSDISLTLGVRSVVAGAEEVQSRRTRSKREGETFLLATVDWESQLEGLCISGDDEFRFYEEGTDKKVGSLSVYGAIRRDAKLAVGRVEEAATIMGKRVYARVAVKKGTSFIKFGKSNVVDLLPFLLPSAEGEVTIDAPALSRNQHYLPVSYRTSGIEKWRRHNCVVLYDAAVDVSTVDLLADHCGHGAIDEESPSGAVKTVIVKDKIAGVSSVKAVLVCFDVVYGSVPCALAVSDAIPIEEESDKPRADAQILKLREGETMSITPEQFACTPGTQISVDWNCSQEDVGWCPNNYIGLFPTGVATMTPVGALITATPRGSGVLYVMQTGKFDLRLMAFAKDDMSHYGPAYLCPFPIVCDKNADIVAAMDKSIREEFAELLPSGGEESTIEGETESEEKESIPKEQEITEDKSSPPAAPEVTQATSSSRFSDMDGWSANVWQTLLLEAGFDEAHASVYSQALEREEVDVRHASILAREDLVALGVRPLGHRLRLLHFLQHQS